MIENISKLGFGLSSLAGSGNYNHQEKLIRTAIDHGITHFDVAPFYGSGDAETILGKILSNCKEDVTITSKYGLIPLGDNKGGRIARNILRPVFRNSKALKRLASGIVNHVHEPNNQINFEKGSLIKSVENSIKKLGKPLDVLLLHEVNCEMAMNEILLNDLHQLQKNGLITYSGVSGVISEIYNPILFNSGKYNVIQVENSLSNPAPINEFLDLGMEVFTHSALRGGLEKLKFLLNKRPGFKDIWDLEIGIDLSHNANLGQLLIEIALFENIKGTVLFSTTKPKRIEHLTLGLENKKLLTPKNYPKILNLLKDLNLQE